MMPVMKQYIYHSLTPDMSSAAVETRLNIMHIVYLCLQTSSTFDDDILCKAQCLFRTFSNQHFHEKFVVREMYSNIHACRKT